MSGGGGGRDGGDVSVMIENVMKGNQRVGLGLGNTNIYKQVKRRGTGLMVCWDGIERGDERDGRG